MKTLFLLPVMVAVFVVMTNSVVNRQKKTDPGPVVRYCFGLDCSIARPGLTKKQLEKTVPEALGVIYKCTDCLAIACISTGTTTGAFSAVGEHGFSSPRGCQ